MLWKDFQKSFPSKTIVNHAFGGSTLLDQLRYADYIILPYKYRQVVIHCGENDIAYSEGAITPHEIAGRLKKLVQKIRSEFPKIYITFISLKPSPSRVQY
jgi:hypothetical protein